MNKLVVAVCDMNDSYRDRFVTYLVDHKNKEITVHAFSAAEHFLAELGRRKFNIVLLGSGFEQLESVLREQKQPAVILRDMAPKKAAEGADCVEDRDSDSLSIFKFQSMESILHEMRVIADGTGSSPVQLLREERRRMEVVGVYSPVRHEMQLPFSMVLSSLLSEKGDVLYLNLMEHSGFLDIFGRTGEKDLGEVLGKLRNGRLEPEHFKRSVYGIEKFCYIPPFFNPEDLHEFSLNDLLALLEFMDKNTAFGAIVIDFGAGLEQFSKMLEVCSSIYCPIKSGYFFQCQVHRFLEYLEQMSDQDLKERLHLLDIPYSAKRIRAGGDILNQLIWSEFGDYVRNYITGAGVGYEIS